MPFNSTFGTRSDQRRVTFHCLFLVTRARNASSGGYYFPRMRYVPGGRLSTRLLQLVEGLQQVGDEVVGVFDTNTQTNQVGRNLEVGTAH